MTQEEIHLGQCWMARLMKRDICVRLESRSPDGGWIARVMSHGRKVKIKSATQLLQRCDKVRIYTVAETTTPNRRSRAVPLSVESRTRKHVPRRGKTVTEPVPLVPLSLLDAAAVVLRKSKTALSTREIIALVVEQGLWEPTGSTPWGSLSAALNRDIQNGTQSRFRKKERGRYSLRQH